MGTTRGAGGRPPDDRGVCTDVVWRAFAAAGYDLKAMVDADIAADPSLYPRTGGIPDPNIDFRRVKNLKVFFDRYALTLTCDLGELSEWQPGDIVIFDDSFTHIGIISDRRCRSGVPWLIHNSGQPRREEPVLQLLHNVRGVWAHYRWIPQRELPNGWHWEDGSTA